MTSTSDSNNQTEPVVERAGIREGGWVVGTRIAGILINLPVGFLNAWILGPAILGSLRVLQAFVEITLNADLGLTKAYQREIPILDGEGDKDQEERTADIVFTVSTLASLTVILVFWVAYGFGFTYGGVFSGARIVALVSLLIICSRIQGFLSKRLTGQGRFVLRSRLDLIMGVFQPAVIVLGVLLFRLEGVLLALILSRIMFSILILWNVPQRFRFSVDFTELRRLLHIGISLWFYDLSNKTFVSLEILLIPLFLDLDSAGLYAFAFGLVATAGSIPVSLHQIFWRNLGVERGEYGLSDTSYMQRHLVKPVALFSLMGAWCLGGGYLGYRVIVGVALPEFADSIFLMLIIMVGWIIGLPKSFASIVISLNDRFNTLVWIQASILLVNLLVDFILISRFGVVGAAIGTGFGYVLSGCVFMMTAGIVLSGWRGVRLLNIFLRLVAASVLSTAFLYASPLLLTLWLPIDDSPVLWIQLLEAFVLGTLYTGWVILVFGLIFWRESLFTELRIQMSDIAGQFLPVIRTRT